MKHKVIIGSETKNKKTILTITASAFIAIVAITGCNTPSEKVEKAQQNVTDAKTNLNQAEADYVADMEKFRMETNERITANQKSIDEYNDRISREKKEVREKYRKKIDELKQKNADMKKRMDDYKEEGNEKWQSFKRGFQHDMDELGQELKDFGRNNNINR